MVCTCAASIRAGPRTRPAGWGYKRLGGESAPWSSQVAYAKLVFWSQCGPLATAAFSTLAKLEVDYIRAKLPGAGASHMHLSKMVYSLRFASRTKTCSKDHPNRSVPVRLLLKQNHPGTGRGAGCSIEGGYTLEMHTDTLGVASSPADRRKGQTQGNP
ncbi:hypothetical protein V492_07456 [Pseudogymnoascus sp. VKM F-4246]|nr:hypothetical protein V492_07456 [Pseudogymnoascus sp. VKM F-4246]